MNNSYHIGERIKSERVRLGLNQSQVAELVGVSREVWGRYERGVTSPGVEKLEGLVRLGANAHFLLSGDGCEGSEAAGLAQLISKLSDADRLAISRMVHSLVDSREAS